MALNSYIDVPVTQVNLKSYNRALELCSSVFENRLGSVVDSLSYAYRYSEKDKATAKRLLKRFAHKYTKKNDMRVEQIKELRENTFYRYETTGKIPRSIMGLMPNQIGYAIDMLRAYSSILRSEVCDGWPAEESKSLRYAEQRDALKMKIGKLLFPKNNNVLLGNLESDAAQSDDFANYLSGIQFQREVG